MEKVFGDFFILHLCTKYYDHMMYASWDMECDRIFCHLGPFFATYTTHVKNLKNQHFEKMKKITGDMITLHLCTTNDNHMMYASRDMEHDRQNFLSFRAIFATLAHSQPEKSKFWKNEKNTWIYHHFTLLYHKQQSCDVWFLRYGAERQNFWSFWTIFYFLFTLLTTRKINILKKWKKCHEISFYTCVP